MRGNPNKLAQFWRELKRRRVVHVITVYATAAFVIIELINNLTDPLNLPPKLLTIVVIVLAVGFPLTIVLSWLYDLTSEGIEKTKPIEELRKGEKSVVPNAWRIATIISFVVIIGLVTINIVMGTRGLRPGDIQSLVILPFHNFTGDDQLEWVSDGMTTSLIGDMGKVGGLRVLGTTTSNAYKETDLTVTDIAKKHNVDALVEPTLTCYGDMVCVQVRVITPYPEEKVLWVGDYMEEKSQILKLYKRISRKIADELMVNLTLQEETLLTESRTVDTAAYDAYLKGIVYLDQFNPESWSVAIESFEKAIEIEPDWADPYTGLSLVGAYKKQMGFGSYSENIITIYENLNKAIELDPNSVETHYRIAGTAAWTEFDWEKAEKEYLKAIELNPSHVRSHSFYAHVLTILRRTDEALYHGKISAELDPENPFTLGLYVMVLLLNEKCEEALFYLEKALSIDPDHFFLAGRLMGIYNCFGDNEKWIELWGEKVQGGWNDEGRKTVLNVFHDRGYIAAVEEMFKMNEKYGNEGCHMDEAIKAERYFILKEYDKVMDYYEMAYENNNHDPNLPYKSARFTYDKMKGNQRYLELLKKMNLPID